MGCIGFQRISVWADQKWIVTYGTHTVWENRKRIDDIGQVQHAQTWTMFGYVWIIAVRKQLSTKTAVNRQRWAADSFAASTKMLDSFNSVLRIVEAQTPPGNVLASEIGWSRRENLTWVSVYHIAWCLWRLLWLFSVLCPVMFSNVFKEARQTVDWSTATDGLESIHRASSTCPMS